MDEYDNEPEYDPDSDTPIPPDPAEASSYFEAPFTDEKLQNLHRLRTTPFKEEAVTALKKLAIYPRGKEALENFIDNYLSEMSLLGKFESKELAFVRFDISELVLKQSFYPTDMKKPGLFLLLNLIRGHYTVIVDRAFDTEDRERILNGKQTQEIRNISMQPEPLRVRNPKKRKNILGF